MPSKCKHKASINCQLFGRVVCLRARDLLKCNHLYVHSRQREFFSSSSSRIHNSRTDLLYIFVWGGGGRLGGIACCIHIGCIICVSRCQVLDVGLNVVRCSLFVAPLLLRNCPSNAINSLFSCYCTFGILYMIEIYFKWILDRNGIWYAIIWC